MFKLHDIVTGINGAHYGITNHDMIAGEVIDISEEKINVKVLIHKYNSNEGESYWVDPKYFILAKPATVVHTQDEWDALPEDVDGVIDIDNGENWVIIDKPKGAYIRAIKSSHIKTGSASVRAYGSASVEAYGSASVRAYDSASVRAYDSASVEAYDSASVRASGSASVEASGSASVEAYGSASVRATGIVQVVNNNCMGKLTALGNARIVFMPRNLQEFFNFHGIEQSDGKVILYKAVRSDDLRSSHDFDFTYVVGKVKKHPCDPNPDEDCGTGLHVATLQWALDFGHEWDDLRIIECEVPVDKIVYPINSTGKVRTSELKVLRVVPLEECGVFGKILAKKQVKANA